MLCITRDVFLEILLGNKESSDGEESCDTYDAYDGAYCTCMVDDNVSCDSEDKNLQSICGSKVDQHTCELKTDYDGKHVV